MSTKELMYLWIVLLILITGTCLNALQILNPDYAEALTIKNSTMSTNSVNTTNPVNTTDSDDKEEVDEPEEDEEDEEDNDIEKDD